MTLSIRINIAFVLSLAAIIFSACQQAEIPNEPETMDPTDIVYATIEDPADTRTSLDGEKVLWTSGDEIVAFMGKTLRRKYVVSSETVGTNEGSFVRDNGYEHIGASEAISHNVAFYPFAEITCKAEGQTYTLANITLPSVQTYVPDSFGPNSFPMMAVSVDTEDADFRFKNLCGVLKLQLTGYVFVKDITISGNSGEILAGPVTVTSSYDSLPQLETSDDGQTSVILYCGNGVQLDEDIPVTFLIYLPPTVFTNGFTVTVTDTWGGSNVFSTTKENEISRSTILRMPVKEYIREPQDNDYIDQDGKNHGPGFKFGENVWAPVNCGYHKTDFKYGKLYQWGRKYGQGYDGDMNNSYQEHIGQYSDASTPEIAQGPVTLLEGQSPNSAEIFYVGAPESDFDWVYPQNDKLWNAGTDSYPVKTEYDPCPSGWRVPTYTEYAELIEFPFYWLYGDSGMNGYCLYDLYSADYPSPWLFFSAAGCRGRDDAQLYNRGSHGCYWSSETDGSYSYNLYFYLSYLELCYDHFGRADGYSVRCVRDENELVLVENISLDNTSLSLDAGNVGYLSAVILPSNANHQTAHWWSDDESIAIVNQNGKVTAISAGTTTITAMAGMQTATCEITVTGTLDMKDYIDEYGINHGQGVMIDGVVWAPVNCGYHATDFKYGKLYQWGRKFGQGYDGEFYDGDWDQTYSDAIVPIFEEGGISIDTGNNNSKSNVFYIAYEDGDWVDPHDGKLWNLGSESNPRKTEYDPCPNGWRVPTYAELYELSKIKSSWTSENDQNGYWYRGLLSNSSSTSQMFLSTAGYIGYNGGNGRDRGRAGSYWSSRSSSWGAYYLFFSSSEVSVYDSSRADAHSVRCVQE